MKLKYEMCRRTASAPYLEYSPIPKGQRCNRKLCDIYVSPMSDMWCKYSSYLVNGAEVVAHDNNAPSKFEVQGYNEIRPSYVRAPRTVRAFRRWLRKNPSGIYAGTAIEAALCYANVEKGAWYRITGRII